MFHISLMFEDSFMFEDSPWTHCFQKFYCTDIHWVQDTLECVLLASYIKISQPHSQTFNQSRQ